MVPLSKLLKPEMIVELQSETKQGVLEELVKVLARDPNVPSEELLLKAILEREALHSTGICLGLGIPHCRLPEIQGFALALGRSQQGIPYEAIDNLPVQVVAMIAAPEGRQEDYLRLLSRVTKFLKHERERIIDAPGVEEIIPLVREY